MLEKKAFHEVVRKSAYDLNYPYEEAWALVSTIVDELATVLDDGDDVAIRGLGTLYWQELPGGTYYDPSRGERRRYPSGFKLRFKPAVRLSVRKDLYEGHREAAERQSRHAKG